MLDAFSLTTTEHSVKRKKRTSKSHDLMGTLWITHLGGAGSVSFASLPAAAAQLSGPALDAVGGAARRRTGH